ncbi:MAG: endonuclease III [Candidatus Levyibacteriota bacterium]
MTKEEKVLEIHKRLVKLYPHPKIALDFTTPLELLVATIMSAQTTDKLVNTLTPALFKKYKTANDYAQANVEDIQALISKVNFSGNKAKNIKAAAQIIVDKHAGKVPDTMEELDALPGVARKTANVVLGQAFHKAEGIVIDTHMIRMSNKLGLTIQTDPVKIEKDLMRIVPKDLWIEWPARLILFGRHECPSRSHECKGTLLWDLYVDHI